MDHINKILFAYPVIYREGMSKDESCIPTPLFAGFKRGTAITMLVNVGIMLTLSSKVHINIEVNRKDNHDPADKTKGNGRFENLKTNIFSGGQAVTLTSLYLEDVLFEDTGMYEIRVSLFGSDDNGDKIDSPIDHYLSYFYFLAEGGV